MQKYSPTAARLVDAVRKIMKETKGKETLVHPEILAKMQAMRPADLDALKPPTISSGFWTDDIGFCKRLAGYIFEASPETIEEMPAGLYPVMLTIISQNFINFMVAAMSE